MRVKLPEPSGIFAHVSSMPESAPPPAPPPPASGGGGFALEAQAETTIAIATPRCLLSIGPMRNAPLPRRANRGVGIDPIDCETNPRGWSSSALYLIHYQKRGAG